MKKLFSFSQYEKLYEGGNAMGGKAVQGIRSIKQSEVAETIQDFQRKIFPLLQIEESDTLVIGSAGNKPNPEDLSGDIDIGIAINRLQENFGEEDTEQTIYNILRENFPKMEINWMKGIHVISTAWPIMGEAENGHVQLDILPIDNMDWAQFIYHQPDYSIQESKYKSAHRNWLFAAILSVMEENKVFDKEGNLVQFDGYLMRLSEGLIKIRKSYQGKTKLLKNPYILREQEEVYTKSPQEFVGFLFGDDTDPIEVTVFENTWELTKKVHPNDLPKIKESLVRFLNRVELKIPSEIETS